MTRNKITFGKKVSPRTRAAARHTKPEALSPDALVAAQWAGVGRDEARKMFGSLSTFR